MMNQELSVATAKNAAPRLETPLATPYKERPPPEGNLALKYDTLCLWCKASTVNLILYMGIPSMQIFLLADRFLDAAATACEGRNSFTTSRGQRGIGPARMVTGDFICVLHGANVPFALRQQGQSFALMSECYVFDLMHSKAVSQVSRPGSKLQQEWIEVRQANREHILLSRSFCIRRTRHDPCLPPVVQIAAMDEEEMYMRVLSKQLMDE